MYLKSSSQDQSDHHLLVTTYFFQNAPLRKGFENLLMALPSCFHDPIVNIL